MLQSESVKWERMHCILLFGKFFKEFQLIYIHLYTIMTYYVYIIYILYLYINN